MWRPAWTHSILNQYEVEEAPFPEIDETEEAKHLKNLSLRRPASDLEAIQAELLRRQLSAQDEHHHASTKHNIEEADPNAQPTAANPNSEPEREPSPDEHEHPKQDQLPGISKTFATSSKQSGNASFVAVVAMSASDIAA